MKISFFDCLIDFVKVIELNIRCKYPYIMVQQKDNLGSGEYLYHSIYAVDYIDDNTNTIYVKSLKYTNH